MAVTDRSTAADLQPRVWVVTVGDGSLRRLLSKVPDQPISGWRTTAVTNLTSLGMAGVSWTVTSPSAQRERIFFARNGKLSYLPYNNDVESTVIEVTGTGNYTIEGGDIAAVTWTPSGVRHIAVLASAKRGANAGFICYYEHNGTSWLAPECTSSAVTATTDLDIVGAVVGTDVHFYYQSSDGGLSRVRRLGDGDITASETVNKPVTSENILPSLFAIESQTAGKFLIGAITATSKKVYTGLVQGSGQPTWSARPVIPNGDLPAASGTGANMSLGAVKFNGNFPGVGPYVRTTVSVVANWKVYDTGTTTDDGATWDTQWHEGIRPGGQGGGQLLWGIGDVATTTALDLRVPRVFMPGGGYTTTLQELSFVSLTTPVFHDHIRRQLPEDVPALGTEATECSVGMGPQSGLGAAMDVSGNAPWIMRVDDTVDGANSFSGTDIDVQPVTLNDSISDPVSDYAEGKFHYVDVEYPASGCADTTSTDDRIVYRRGTTASSIANKQDVITIAHALNPSFDHPWIVATEGPAPGFVATAHVLYWDQDASRVKYWRLPPSGVPDIFTLDPVNALPSDPPVVLRGANNIYGSTFDPPSNGDSSDWPKLCNITDPNNIPACVRVSGNPVQTPYPKAKDIPFGAPQGSQQELCTEQFNGQWYKCLQTEEPVSLAASPTIANKIYAVYQAADPTQANGLTSIYFTRSTGGTDFGAWEPTKRINPGDTYFYFDPEITVDDEGTLIVTYSRLLTTDPTGVAEEYVAWSFDDGVTWSQDGFSSWDAHGVPLYCKVSTRRKWFIGDFRQGNVVGGRASQLLRFGGSTDHYQYTQWFSRWQIR